MPWNTFGKQVMCFFKEGTPELEAWVLERLERLLEGRVSDVVAGMTRMATIRGLSDKQRKPVDKAAEYLLKHKTIMRYNEMLANSDFAWVVKYTDVSEFELENVVK